MILCKSLRLFYFYLQVIFVMSTLNYSELQYKRPLGVYEYPNWAILVGWSLAAFSAIFIPIMIPVNIWRYGLNFKVSPFLYDRKKSLKMPSM